jgi:hypothetical protein
MSFGKPQACACLLMAVLGAGQLDAQATAVSSSPPAEVILCAGWSWILLRLVDEEKMLNRKVAVVLVLAAGLVWLPSHSRAVERPDTTFRIFQFPADSIPRIDGDTSEWSVVPDAYAIGIDQLVDTEGGHGAKFDRADLDVRVKVGWVKGLNRLYFLYEAFDNYWDFSRPDLHNDIFEVVVDGDMSGGPLIDQYHRDIWTPEAVGAARASIDTSISRAQAEWSFHGAHAQNYHVFTPPAEGKDWP